LTTSPRRPTPASRAVRRSRRPAPRSTTFLERNRDRLLWAGGITAFVALIFVGLVLPQFTPAYECVNMFDPSPAPSFVASNPAPVASGATAAPAMTPPPPGFVEPDMGNQHEANIGAKVTYTWCPPASGRHYPAPGGPIKAGLYGPDDKTVPEGWVHNLEHGAIVLLYRCQSGDDACTDAGQAAIEALYARWPTSPICKVAAPGTPNLPTPVITRFDDMPYPYAALVWDVVLPMQTLDEKLLFEFYAGYGERFNPEKQCVAPTASPAPPPTGTAPAPTGTVPLPSASSAPAAS
jgi:hypothetical protein